jgi:hypothetical protein
MVFEQVLRLARISLDPLLMRANATYPHHRPKVQWVSILPTTDAEKVESGESSNTMNPLTMTERFHSGESRVFNSILNHLPLFIIRRLPNI